MLQVIEREIEGSSVSQLNAYLLGAIHDGTYSRIHRTVRISQRGPDWPLLLKVVFRRLGRKSWIYREGNRGVWVVESCTHLQPTARFEAAQDRLAYVRGYFDAEGGIPRASESRVYTQFVQKDNADLEEVRSHLHSLGVDCGLMHNPSRAVDPEYWRFYVRCRSWSLFAHRVGSWHPRKRTILDLRFPSAANSESLLPPKVL